MKKVGFQSFLLAAIFILTGCATHLTKPSASPKPATVRLSEFKSVEMKSVGISERFSANGANQKALRKIDELLFQDMRMIFPELKRIEAGQEFSAAAERTLQIVPTIKEIKFIGGAARFWAGAMAGSSAVLMQATYKDSSTGDVIADPEFYRSAGAYAGAWSIGNTDNRMLEDIAKDIVNYSSYNR